MKLRTALLIGTAVALGLAVKRRPGRRQVRLGAIADPEAAHFYLQVSNLPQFRLINWIVSRRATRDGVQGRALDIGCGPGKLAVQLALRAPGLEVTGIDPSPEMVRMAVENAQRSGLGARLSFLEGASERVPFPDSSFDLVVSTLSLHHWADPAQGLGEIARVLKPGGRFVVLDFRRDVALLPWAFLSLVQHYVLPHAARHAGEPLGSIQAAYTPQEAARLAREAGLPSWRVTSGPAWLTIESEV